MQNSGLVRRIDDLGRIVIPKEIRRTLRIRSGDAIEINKEGENLVLKKYSPFSEFSRLIESLSNALSSTTNKDCIVTDTDKIIYSSRENVLEAGSILTSLCNKIMNERKPCVFKSNEQKIPVIYIAENVEGITQRMFVPIVKDGDCFGLVVLSAKGGEFSKEEQRLIDYTLKVLTNNV